MGSSSSCDAGDDPSGLVAQLCQAEAWLAVAPEAALAAAGKLYDAIDRIHTVVIARAGALDPPLLPEGHRPILRGPD